MKKYLAIFALVIIAVGGAYAVNRSGTKVPPLPETSEFEVVTLGRGYYLEKRSKDPNEFSSHIYHDFRLVHQGKDGTIQELIPSIKEAIPELKEQFNRTLGFLSFPDDSKQIFFQSILMNTDAGGGPLYAFNIDENIFTRLNAKAESYVRVLSPSGRYMASIPPSTKSQNIKTITLIDLEKDTVRDLTTLQKSNETLNACAHDSCFNGIIVMMNWQGQNTLEYHVYDKTVVLPTSSAAGFDTHPLIEKRLVNL